MYMRVLMELRPLTNCCVLAARWHVNGSTCDRGPAELTAPSVYLGHNMSIWMFVGMHLCGVMPMHFNFILFEYMFFSTLVHDDYDLLRCVGRHLDTENTKLGLNVTWLPNCGQEELKQRSKIKDPNPNGPGKFISRFDWTRSLFKHILKTLQTWYHCMSERRETRDYFMEPKKPW